MSMHNIDKPGFKMETLHSFTGCTDCCNRDGTINLAVFQPYCESLSLKEVNCSKIEKFGPFFKLNEMTWISGCGTTYIYENFIQLSNTTVPNLAISSRSTSDSFMLLFYAFVLLFVFKKVSL